MYETGPHNLELMRLLRSCPHPVATSFAQDVYRRMPNDTDFSHFLEAGFTGYNFAMIMGFDAYHHPSDTPENLDRRSLAHYGSYALTLGRRLSQTDLDSLHASEDGVFFTVFRGLLVVYPASWAVPLAIVACVLFGVLTFILLRRRQLSIVRLLLGIFFSVFIVALAVGTVIVGMKLIAAAYNGHWLGLTAGPATANAVTIIFLSVTVLVALAFKSWVGCRLGSTELLAGSLLIWLVLAVLTAIYLRGFSYLFLWPALFATAALFLIGRANRPSPSVQCGAMLCTLVPGCLLFAPTTVLAYEALGISLLPVLGGLASFQAFLIHVPAREAQSASDPARLSTGRSGG
jgi:hypothetical protein